MASGKSTFAAWLDAQVYDVDKVIEETTGMAIDIIFNQYGQDYFRWIEAQYLRKTSDCSKCIVAVGGGCPMYYHNMDWMLSEGVVIYLRVKFSTLLNRIRVSPRPLANVLSDHELQALYHERDQVYKKADYILDLNEDPESNLTKLSQVIDLADDRDR